MVQNLHCHFCFRVTHSTDPKAFHGLFEYLEDNIIYKDKAGMWQCIHAVAGIVFEKFLDRMAEKVCTVLCVDIHLVQQLELNPEVSLICKIK